MYPVGFPMGEFPTGKASFGARLFGRERSVCEKPNAVFCARTNVLILKRQINFTGEHIMPVNSQMQAVLDQYSKFDPPAIETLTPENARNAPTLKNAVEEMTAESIAARARMVARPSLPEPVGKIDHALIPGPGGDILARIYIPDGEGPFPTLVYFHGGGWVIANLDVYESSCRALCNAVGCIVVSVAYRQAPEHKYPAAVEDAYAA